MRAIGRTRRLAKPAASSEEVVGKARLSIALFGMRDGAAWVADDAFVTRQGEDILVEKWVGHRVVSILVQRTSALRMADLWSRLAEIAVDAQDFPTPPKPREGFA